jgi:serine/threonine protein kinase
MTNDRLNKIEQLFETALPLPKKERTAYLKSKTESKKIISEVLELLQAHDELGSFLTEPLSIENDFIPVCPDLSGRLVNVWQIDHLIGQGGMGRVYLAQRADGEYQQTVAFKVVEYKAFDNSSFLRERQILADLDHPNIVSLLDAGTLEEGFPYLIMEYIDGLPIDQWVKQHKEFTQNELIILFIKLCKIVQSAHDHGIIHCDLKPSNIYVSNDGALKLLDFGIAQLLHDANAQNSDKKQSFSFTPEYSSPNRHQQKYPTVQDDIFSLGIIFAQLITGQVPLMQHNNEYSQPDIEAIAEQLNNTELQAIFLAAVGSKAAAKQYRTLAELIDDLGYYLDNLPVKALADNFFYSSKKNLQRNWIQWLSAILILALIMVGGVSYWQSKKAEQESRFVREMAETLLNNMDDSLKQLPKTTPTRQLLIKSAVDQLESLQQYYPDNIHINKMLAKTYWRLGVVVGSPFVLSMGKVKEARLYQDKALNLYLKILPLRSDVLLAYNDISRVKREIAKLYAANNDTEKMRSLYAEMLQEMEQVYKNQPIEKKHALAVVYIVGAHGEMHLDNIDYARQLLNQAEKILQALDVSEHTKAYEIETRFIEEERANILLLRNKYSAAESIYRKLLDKKPQHKQWRIVRSLIRINTALGCVNLHKQRKQSALQYFRQARVISMKLSSKYPAVESLKLALQRYKVLDKLAIIDNKELARVMYCNTPRKFMMPLDGS